MKCCLYIYFRLGEQTSNGKLSKDIPKKYNEIQWHAVNGLRNFIVHEYHNLEPNIIMKTYTKRIPELKEQLLEIKKDLSK